LIIETLSTFPHMYDSVMGSSMMRIAQEKGILDFTAYDLRDWTHDRHRTTDDDPFGGGCGLIMKCEPIFEAYEDLCGLPHPQPPAAGGEPKTGPAPQHADAPAPKVVFLSPCGRTLDEELVRELAHEERLLFICGHYEGIDERVYALADYEVSLGDYVLTSGELASMVIIDAVVRKLDGVLEYPQYTRPADFRGQEVPPVLLSGDHGAVARWRRERALERTARLRPDLIERAAAAGELDDADWGFLKSCDEAVDRPR
jgi:tRNA (guanine37-N1)-methyltransferase